MRIISFLLFISLQPIHWRMGILFFVFILSCFLSLWLFFYRNFL